MAKGLSRKAKTGLLGGFLAVAGTTLLMAGPLENQEQRDTIPSRVVETTEQTRSLNPQTQYQQLINSKVSQRGINLIKQFEGFSPVVYDPVPKDGIDEPTIGYGHLIQQGEDFTRLSRSEAEVLLRKDVLKHEQPVRDYVTVPLTQGQYDALTSFVYNVGENAFKKSTLLRRLNDGDYVGAAKEFSRWNRSNGKVLKGLTKRRNLERKLFLNN